MSKKDKLVVRAGYVTVRSKVGAGMAYVDVPQGAPLPDDVSDEDRDRLLLDGLVGPEDTTDDGREPEHTDPDGNPVTRPVPGEVDPAEIDPDVIPAGTTEEVMEWVGDDLARARVARHEERAKGDKARAGLIEELERKMADLESEPPTVSEALPPEGPTSAPAGGVAVPHDTGEAAGQPADATPAPAARRTRKTAK